MKEDLFYALLLNLILLFVYAQVQLWAQSPGQEPVQEWDEAVVPGIALVDICALNSSVILPRSVDDGLRI
jgi:hypothetical protein